MSTPTTWLVGAAIAIVVAVAMEPWARLLHGRLWHARLWSVHRSHHGRRAGRFERNDVLSATHAPFAAALVMIGCNLHGIAAAACIGTGVGMTIFGIAYVLVHDGYVHGRLPVRFLGRSAWLRRVRDAHAVHHARGAAPYGFFLGSRELTQTPRARVEPPSERRPSARAPASPRGTPRDAARRSAEESP